MNARHQFEIASSASLRAMLGRPLDNKHDHLLVTGLYLGSPLNLLRHDKTKIFTQTLGQRDEANETLNSIAHWMCENNIMDQRSFHGDRRYDYNVTFYHLPAGEMANLSVADNFYLEDFVFSHCNPSNAGHFDDLMQMLDRDRLGGAMRASLTDNFKMQMREDAPHFWLRDMRQCGHPDYRGLWPAPAPILAAA